MKNIHIIPADQPSRLCINPIDGKLVLDKKPNTLNSLHIYITSENENINENDYIITKRGKLVIVDYLLGKDLEGACKVILTTNTTLIANGVQAIHDEFLEWFVKNPSCDFVEVEREKAIGYAVDRQRTFYGKYKIIISQEEPKQVICRDKFDRVIQDGYYVDVQNDGVHKVYRKEDGQLYFKPYGEEERVSNYFSNDLILIPYSTKLITDLKKEIADKKQEEPKQETLEEAAERLYPTTIDSFTDTGIDMSERDSMIVPPDATNIEVFAIKPDENGELFAYIGYKISNGNFEFSVVPFTEPKPERMYSEEEVIALLEYTRENFYDTGTKWHSEPDTDLTSEELVQQFKKK
jgi:hypothetical protein